MTDNLDEIRLADFALEQSKKTSFFIEKQFPAIYRENGRELIELVKSYYRFLEENDAQSVYNIRRIYNYRNIDTTLERMLIFFKNKFLNGLFFEEDTRFIVKNILDLYRRKGSKEGIELFFKLFFDSEVEIYFPSQDMFKPSTSLWKTGSFIQMYSTTDFRKFKGVVNRKIFGDKSKAEAFVDNVYFVNIRGAYVPILFISSVRGEFAGFDVVFSVDPRITYGTVYGSLRSVDIDQNALSTGGNEVGDIVDILSDTGFGAKGRVSDVSRELSGEIQFRVRDGNYGYTTSNTSILVSDQNIFFGNDEGNEFIINERIKQDKANTEVFASVIGTKSDSIGLYLDYSELDEQILFVNTSGTEYNPNEEIVQQNSFGLDVFGTVISEQEGFIVVQLDKSKPGVETQRYFFERGRSISTTNRVEDISKLVTDVEDDYFFEDGFDVETSNREVNISKPSLFVTARNTTASAEIGTISNTETITIITDLIENYLNVQLDSSNYSLVPPAELEMSGTRVNGVIPNLNTQLNEAFVPETFTVGSIATLKNINPGFNHVSDVFVIARENLLRRFNLQDQVLNLSIPSGVIIFEDDILEQTKTIQNFEGQNEQVSVRGVVVRVQGNNVTVKQLTFESFVTDEPLFKQGSTIPVTVNSRTRDFTSLPLGLNAQIDGDVEVTTGKIREIKVFDSGIGYEDGSLVRLQNTTKESTVFDAIGTANARRQGITEGKWRSFESHINQEKVIQDSFFYQDYSYQLTTDIEPSSYEFEFKELMHPTGIKLFTNFGKVDVINIDVDILTDEIRRFRVVEDNLELITEQNEISILAENGLPYLSSSIIEEV
jgi:hypothetical protein